MFGSSTWLTINAIWVELSLYTGRLPEAWSLPSYLAAIIQLACVGPLLYSVLHKCVGLRIEKPPLILILLAMSTVSMLLLALFWEWTMPIFGSQHSVAILLLTFLMALVAATSNVLFLPFMATFHPNYLTAYFVGMSFSSLVPSVLKLIQGVGNYECHPSTNGTTNTTTLVAVYTEPLFHIRFYNLAMFAWMCAATASFAFLYWNVRGKAKGTTTTAGAKDQQHAEEEANTEEGGADDGKTAGGGTKTVVAQRRTKRNGKTTELASDNDGEGEEDGEEEEWRREQRPLKSSLKTASSSGHGTGTTGDAKNNDNSKLRYWTLIACLSLICAEMNTIIPSILSYAALAYSLLTYHLALTLSNLSHPLANFLPLWFKPRSLFVVLVLVSICTVGTGLIFMLALQSPEPIFRDSAPAFGSTIAITLSVLTGFLCSYLRTHITGLIRGEHPDSESLLFWCGVFMQVGSFLGACAMFPLVNIFNVFKKREPCT
ncbi:hypothetical protein niasHT_032957 [Heterodera trifolii]|uniref:Riboflavin transporter n=1 Tax=Heterodera trifolii TaxID=157864 RepID=A0ABD2HR99_9BILA